MRTYNVAVVGATGAVGKELIKILIERNFPLSELRLLASERSHGKEIDFNGSRYTISKTTAEAFEGMDIALFAGGAAGAAFAQEAVNKGAIVIDNSSAFRYDPDVPLVVPEVNPEDVDWNKGIIANPNCSTIQMVVALKPLHDAATIKRIIVSTYQAVSGAGAEGISELREQTNAICSSHNDGSLSDPPLANTVFPHQIAFNLIPHIDVFLENGYTKEEMKMVWETQKMFHSPQIAVSATAVRVPVYRSHSEAISIETEKHLSAAEARQILSEAPGVVLIDNPQEKEYPMPLYASDTDSVYVGRIREDITNSNGLTMWVVADQLRKGAATNAVQIAELLIKRALI